MSDDVLISKVKSVCSKKPNERTNSELQELQELTKSTKVFKNLIETKGESAHLMCCRYLFYEFCPENTYLFKVGDLGSKFYIIISGKVGVEIPIKDENTGGMTTLEVVQFSKGGSFGELALESSKPRAASIKCKSPCHFVVLEKADYNRMVSKLVRDKRSNLVNFLQSLPIFSKITKGTIAKLTYNFKEKDFLKGQVVYREGDLVKDVYIVIEGEFLFQKRIKVEDGRKKQMFYTETYNEATEVQRFRARGLKKKLIQIGDVAKLGVREIFGIEEDEDEIRKFTCICSSSTAKVLSIEKSDFLQRIQGEDVLGYIKQRNSQKDEELNNRTAMWRFIAEDKASSLSPIQMRKREKDISNVLKSEEKPRHILKKSETIQSFSRRMKALPNEYLYRSVDKELKKIGSPFNHHSKKSSIPPKNQEPFHLRSISTQRNLPVRKLPKVCKPVISPSPSIELKLHNFYHMNSKVMLY